VATHTGKTRQPNGASSIYQGKDGRWHGRVTVGTKDDGTPDRRHVSGKTRAETTTKVRELERQRDLGTVRKPGKPWTLAMWLTHWIENIAPITVSENTLSGYEVAVRVHLIPGLGAHRLTKLEPEHLERLYKKMQDAGSAPATAHQVHRTLRVALGEAVRRGRLTVNVAKIAKPRALTRRRSSRTPKMRCSGSSWQRANAVTASGGSSRLPSVYAGARSSACNGRTSTWTPA